MGTQNEAIENDASDQSQETNVDPKAFGADRTKILNAIAKKRGAEREEEDFEPGELDARYKALESALSEGAADAIDEDADYTDNEASVQNTSDAGEPVYKRNGEWYAKEKVNGEIIEVPLKKILANTQKLDAGDARLREAAERKRLLDQRESQLTEYEHRLQQQLPAQGAATEDLMELSRNHREALLSGDDDLADELFVKAITATNRVQTLVDAGKIKADIMGEIHSQRERETLKTEVTQFAEQNQDIISDPVLFKVADQMTLDIKNQNPEWSSSQVLAETSKKVRKWMASKGMQGSTERAGRKKANATITGVNARRPMINPDPKPKTTSSVINEMRRARGQAPIAER